MITFISSGKWIKRTWWIEFNYVYIVQIKVIPLELVNRSQIIKYRRGDILFQLGKCLRRLIADKHRWNQLAAFCCFIRSSPSLWKICNTKGNMLSLPVRAMCSSIDKLFRFDIAFYFINLFVFFPGWTIYTGRWICLSVPLLLSPIVAESIDICRRW